MKAKHNKKRNTAFLYETLVRELTKAVVEANAPRREKVTSVIKEYFRKGGVLAQELDAYRTLVETTGLTEKTAERLLIEAKQTYQRLDKKSIFKDQSTLIKIINSEFSDDVWNNFIPNYKALATVSSIFNEKTPLGKRVIYENSILEQLVGSPTDTNEMEPIDNIVYKSFVEKFNDHYGELLEEQRDLLQKYISSFADNGLELKTYLNEEIGRLKTIIKKSLTLEEVKTDLVMLEKTNRVLRILEDFKTVSPTEGVVKTILKIQNLTREIRSK